MTAARFSSKISDIYSPPTMADPNDQKKETVRIDLPLLPQPPVAEPPDPSTKSRETVRIQLPNRQLSVPLRPPTGPPLVSTPIDQDLRSPQFFQPPPTSSPVSPPKPPTVSVPLPTPAPVPVTPAANLPSLGPKKETARIARMPDPPLQPLPTVQMKKTQPLIAMPLAAPQSASIAVAPEEESIMPLCWVLLGVSTVILIIQIWTYLS